MSVLLAIGAVALLFVAFCLLPPRGGLGHPCRGCPAEDDPERCGGCPLGDTIASEEEVEVES